MARQRNEIYIENGWDYFYVDSLEKSGKLNEYDVEVYKILQVPKLHPYATGFTYGVDFLYKGILFYHYITPSPDAIIKDRSHIDRMFEMSFKDALAIW